MNLDDRLVDLGVALDDLIERYDRTTGRLQPHRQRRWLALVAVTGVMLSVGAGLAIVLLGDGDPPARSVSSQPPPEGVEVPLVASEPLAADVAAIGPRPIKPGSLFTATVADRDVTGYVTINWPGMIGTSVEETRCVEIDGLGTCVGRPGSHLVRLVQGSGSVPAWIIWQGLPANTAYVQIELGDDRYWQRPVGDTIVVPDQLGQALRAVAVGADGTALAIEEGDAVDADTPPASGPVETVPQFPVYVTNQGNDRVFESVNGCLDSAGAADPLTPPANAEQTWQYCIAVADADLEDFLATIYTSSSTTQPGQRRRPTSP